MIQKLLELHAFYGEYTNILLKSQFIWAFILMILY